ncbi:MAG: hypothetical protein JOZ51_06825, partial [Chloroflexi bacterium]|nr:hypothetical protein [Chloroflexota bacterium]
ASATASAATPAPRAATPALEWSALPLLQRLSADHALPATPTVSTPAPGGISVAARVINRMAIDQPGAAPMPLLRVHAPSTARAASEGAPTSAALLRSPAAAAADSSAGISADSPVGQSFTPDDTGTASFSEQAVPASADFGGQSAPAIHRSAILPSLSSAAFQPLTLLRMHVPDAPSMAQADAPVGSSSLQRSPDAPNSTAPITSPVMMRAAEQPSISALASVSGDHTGGTPTRTSSPTSPSLPALVHRSPIVPLLPTATLQREPTASATASAVLPAPRAVTPALEWSALPLLQRLSTAHALPATPTASAAAPTSGTSVAAQVINRMAIDQPGATPMPLLRMHTPTDTPLLSREADPEVAASADGSAPGSASESSPAQPSLMSSLVRRSPILASAPSFASQADNAGSMVAPATETSSGIAQRSPADYALPMLQRTSVQRFFGGRPGLKLPSLGGIQNSVNSLAGQAQGMVGQVTNMPGQLMGQAQGMVNQVTGMPNQLMGQAQGMLDQVTGMPNQLMGQAQGMIDQVTGMPNQLMGQAQGMIDQVTGMPNQLMGQAQGMIDQVTGMPGQLMGQAQGMMNQVTGLPNQLMGQAQGMLDQVTGMPNQLMGQAQGMLDQAGGFPGQMQDAANNLLGARSSQLTLLRPVRSESQSAPVQDADEAQNEAATGSSGQAAAGGAGGAGGAGKQAPGEGGKQGKPDIDMLAQQVYARLRHRLLIDRERLGH